MSPNVQKLLPSALVIAAAAYFGWESAGPSYVNEDVTRATSVRWKADDLVPPAMPSVTVDPFASVLVVSAEQEIEEETGKLVPASRPAGPPARELHAGLSLTGIARMGSRNWAILNGRPRLSGDSVKTDDNNQHECVIVSVEADHVIVRCQETVTQIRLRKQQARTTLPGAPGSRAAESSAAPANQPVPEKYAPPPLSM